jgi:DNA excision repair protein ERCC-1
MSYQKELYGTETKFYLHNPIVLGSTLPHDNKMSHQTPSSDLSNVPSKVSNPYSKKKNVTQNDFRLEQMSSRGSEPPVFKIPTVTTTAATFSQAFSSIENTIQYRTDFEKMWHKDPTDVEDILEKTIQHQEQQQIFETEAAREEATRLESRDHHALLQPHVLYVSTKQKGNGVLKFLRNVPFAYSKMIPDYIMSSQRCALFLSMKYHALYPEYIHRRIAELKTDFKIRILLVLVDVEDNANILLFLNRLAVLHNLTLILSWSEEEAARYLETYKALDGKDASSIQRRKETNFLDQVSDFITTVRSVNKTDVTHLLAQFTSVQQIMAASEDELALCPGLGEKKVKRLWEAFHKPFSNKRTKTSMVGEKDTPETTTDYEHVKSIQKATDNEAA